MPVALKSAQWGSGDNGAYGSMDLGQRCPSSCETRTCPREMTSACARLTLKREPGFKTLEWLGFAEVVATYPEYIQKALKGQGARYFSRLLGRYHHRAAGVYDTAPSISGAAYVPLVKVYTLSGNQLLPHPRGPTGSTRTWEPNPVPDAMAGSLLTIEDALPYVEAFRVLPGPTVVKGSAAGLPPEMQNFSVWEELQPIRDYIATDEGRGTSGSGWVRLIRRTGLGLHSALHYREP